MNNQAQFKVNISEAEAFAKVWNFNGIAVNVDPVMLKFGTDFSNIVLKNFILMCQKQAQEAAAAQIKAQNQKALIIEGA